MEEAAKDIKRLTYEKEKLIDISNMLRSDIVQLNDKLSSQSKEGKLNNHHGFNCFDW